jgi:hypothetical protein
LRNDPEFALPAFTGNSIGQSRRNWTGGPAKTEQEKMLRDHRPVLGHLRGAGVTLSTVIGQYHARGVVPLRRRLLTPKFGKGSDSWVRFDKESVWWKEGSFQRYSAKRSAVSYLLRFGKGTVELILRDWTVTWFNQGRRMDG